MTVARAVALRAVVGKRCVVCGALTPVGQVVSSHNVDCGYRHYRNLPPPRDFKRDVYASRRRGARRGLAARYALRNLPPLEEDEP
jgi:hypothetical protein